MDGFDSLGQVFLTKNYSVLTTEKQKTTLYRKTVKFKSLTVYMELQRWQV